jgi:hypothetical protein
VANLLTHRRLLYGVSLAIIPLVGILDGLTGYEIDFSVFYYVPLALAGWFLSRRVALTLAVLAVATWLAADVVAGHAVPDLRVAVWNATFELVTYVAVAWVVGWMRTEHDRLRTALEQVKQLSGLLPVCAWCHRVRSDEGYWLSVDRYLREQTGVQVTHGICPDCAAKQLAELG